MILFGISIKLNSYLSKLLLKSYTFQILFSRLRSRDLKRFYSSESVTHTKYRIKTIIYMADGKLKHGGLCDRLYGMVSTYYACRLANYNFKINHIYPFNLSDYLIPNKYNWIIDKNRINFNINIASPFFYPQIGRPMKLDDFMSQLNKVSTSEIHIYTNIHLPDNLFGELFNELFMPSPKLNKIYLDLKGKFGRYVSVTYRFQQLLGDFKEGNFQILDTNGRNKLIKKCINSLLKIREIHRNELILVTSDSSTFLSEVSKFEFVRVIPGNLVHMDFCTNETPNLGHMKAFVDLLMISNALKVYCIWDKKLYHTHFAKTGALIGNRPYEEIYLK